MVSIRSFVSHGHQGTSIDHGTETCANRTQRQANSVGADEEGIRRAQCVPSSLIVKFCNLDPRTPYPIPVPSHTIPSSWDARVERGCSGPMRTTMVFIKYFISDGLELSEVKSNRIKQKG